MKQEHLLFRRKALRLLQKPVAERLGLLPAELGRIERCEVLVTAEYVAKISDVLDAMSVESQTVMAEVPA